MMDTYDYYRELYHVTLGEMIDFLTDTDINAPVLLNPAESGLDFGYNSIGYPHSFKGIHSDMAFEPSAEKMFRNNLLRICQGAVNSSYAGYKGGEFTMTRKTPLWVSEYGEDSGIAIVQLRHVQQTKSIGYIDLVLRNTRQTKG